MNFQVQPYTKLATDKFAFLPVDIILANDVKNVSLFKI